MKRITWFACFTGALWLTGCVGEYTSIRKADDGTYAVTRTKHGFFRTYGTLFKCAPQATGDLKCDEVDSP